MKSYRYRCNTQEKDFEIATGIYYLGARYYDSRIGRMLSEDPRQATCAYNSNSPLYFVDVFWEL